MAGVPRIGGRLAVSHDEVFGLPRCAYPRSRASRGCCRGSRPNDPDSLIMPGSHSVAGNPGPGGAESGIASHLPRPQIPRDARNGWCALSLARTIHESSAAEHVRCVSTAPLMRNSPESRCARRWGAKAGRLRRNPQRSSSTRAMMSSSTERSRYSQTASTSSRRWICSPASLSENLARLNQRIISVGFA